MLRKWLLGSKDSRPPFLKPPLAFPGDRLRDMLDENIFRFSIAATLPIVLFLVLIYNTIFSGKLSHLNSFLIHLAALSPFFVISFYFARKSRKEIKNYRLGYIGEQVIGQELERARTMGYTVFHDIENREKKFNVDHIAIGKAGIVVIETKAKSKPKKGSPEIKYDGKTIMFPDNSYTTDPLDQVEGNAKWIQDLAHKLISQERKPACHFDMKNPVPTVRVVVYPGWHIDYSEAQKARAPIIVTNDSLLVDSVIKSLKPDPKLTDEMVEELQDLFERHFRHENKEMIEY